MMAEATDASAASGHGGADVRPAEGNHLELAAKEDALLEMAADKADERAGHQGLVELELIEDAFHTSEEGNNDDESNRDWSHVSDPPY